jgi:hypothetical protein
LELSAGCASPEIPATRAGTARSGGAGGPPEVVEWTVSPWRERRARAALALGLALLLALTGVWFFRGPALVGIVLALAVLSALAPAIVATRCRVDAEGVSRRVLFGWERRSWPGIRRARLDPEGLFVSPFERASRLDAFRGLVLPLPRGGGRILERIEREVRAHGL